MQTLEFKGIGFGASATTNEPVHQGPVPPAMVPAAAPATFLDRAMTFSLSGDRRLQLEETCQALSAAKNYLILNLGFSYSLYHTIPLNHVRMNIFSGPRQESQNDGFAAPLLIIFGVSKYKVNRVAADIYRYKEPEPYKEKGIRYDGEKLFPKRKQKKKS
jgi:hypothetical protein